MRQNQDSSFLKEFHQLDKDITKINYRLRSLEDNYYDGITSQNDFERIRQRYKADKEDKELLQLRMKGRKTSFRKYLDYGLPLINNIGIQYEKAPIEIKQKIVGSIYPKDLIFQDQKYRTTEEPSMLSLITLNINELRENKNDGKDFNNFSPFMVAPPGLEPGSKV